MLNRNVALISIFVGSATIFHFLPAFFKKEVPEGPSTLDQALKGVNKKKDD